MCGKGRLRAPVTPLPLLSLSGFLRGRRDKPCPLLSLAGPGVGVCHPLGHYRVTSNCPGQILPLSFSPHPPPPLFTPSYPESPWDMRRNLIPQETRGPEGADPPPKSCKAGDSQFGEEFWGLRQGDGGSWEETFPPTPTCRSTSPRRLQPAHLETSADPHTLPGDAGCGKGDLCKLPSPRELLTLPPRPAFGSSVDPIPPGGSRFQGNSGTGTHFRSWGGGGGGRGASQGDERRLTSRQLCPRPL